MLARFVLAAAIVLLTGCQDMFVYFPTTDDESSLVAQARQQGLEPWPHQGEGRMGWRAPPAQAETDRTGGQETARLLVFHGNAGHSLHRQHFVTGFQSTDDSVAWEVFLFEYPGYGSRPGNPSEETIMQAAAEALELLLAQDDSRPVYLLGESLGSGVASRLAAEYPDAVPGILLITPFTNLEDVGAARFPRVLVTTILRDRYDSEKALSSYRGRVAFLIAGRDEVVTTELGQSLYEGYPGPKERWVQETAGHNTLNYSPHSPWWQEVSDFLKGTP
ncbi:MAG: alpha/beta hydrolase [Alkalispirochaeta sp.]